MGIASSLKRRLGIGKKQSFRRRRRSEQHKRQRAADLKLMGRHLDTDWYAEQHGLDNPKAALMHFVRYGRNLGLSPNPKLVGADGVTLSHWGAEFLLRSGLKIGEKGSAKLEPGDQRADNPLTIRNTGGKKLAVVSAIFGGYDRLLPIDPSWLGDADFYLLSDRFFSNNNHWKQIHGNYHNADPTRRARFCKLHLPTYFSEYDWVMWVDGNILICSNPVEVLNGLDLANIDFATFDHPDRNSLINEAATCARMGKEDAKVLAGHLRNIQNHDGFLGSTLYETMVLVLRPSSPSVRAASAAWWRFMMSGSRRDQLSLPLVLQGASDIRVGALPGSIKDTPHFAKIRH